MKPFNIGFGDTQHLKVSDLSIASELRKSEVGRAAIQLGLMQIQELLARDLDRGRELIMINSAKGKM